MTADLWFFDVLGIEPTKDKTVIKQAFSKLAHETNPEDDQEGYAELHDAYKAALQYAAGADVNKLHPEHEIVKTESTYDFSTLNVKEKFLDLDATELRNVIRNFKTTAGIYSYDTIFNRPKENIIQVIMTLFKLYSELADRTNVEGAMVSFLAEPLIIYSIEDEVLRDFLKNNLPEEDPCRAVITAHIEEYEKKLEQRKIQQKIEEAEFKILSVIRARWGISAAVFAALAVLTILLFEKLTHADFSIGVQLLLFFTGAAGFCGIKFYTVSASTGHGRSEDRRVTLSLFMLLLIVINVVSWLCLKEDYFSTTINYYICLAICIIFTLADLFVQLTCLLPVLLGKKKY